jgi:hypothetical protein
MHGTKVGLSNLKIKLTTPGKFIPGVTAAYPS